jgi:hypothetical protein
MILAFASRGAVMSPPRTSGILGDLVQQTDADALPGASETATGRRFFSLAERRPVILTPAREPRSACGAEAAGALASVRRKWNVQPHYDREQRHRQVEEIL